MFMGCTATGNAEGDAKRTCWETGWLGSRVAVSAPGPLQQSEAAWLPVGSAGCRRCSERRRHLRLLLPSPLLPLHAERRPRRWQSSHRPREFFFRWMKSSGLAALDVDVDANQDVDLQTKNRASIRHKTTCPRTPGWAWVWATVLGLKQTLGATVFQARVRVQGY